MTKIVDGKNKALVRSLVITVLKKITMPTNILSQKTNNSLSNFYIDICQLKGHTKYALYLISSLVLESQAKTKTLNDSDSKGNMMSLAYIAKLDLTI